MWKPVLHTANRYLAALLCCIVTVYAAHAQLLPKEGAALNCRLIRFSFPEQPDRTWTIEIAEGDYDDAAMFGNHVMMSASDTVNTIIATVPSFGKKYTWRVVSVYADGVMSRSDLHHFSTLSAPATDSNSIRLRVLHHAKKHEDAYVFLDGTRALYDMEGRPVWFLRDIAGVPGKGRKAEDLKLTPQGTITFMSGRRNATLCEVNYNGELLWKHRSARNRNTSSDRHFHHEFTRLANGHYMAMGNEVVFWKLPKPVDKELRKRADIKPRIVQRKGDTYQRILLSTVVVYDAQHNEVWKWRSSDHFKQGTGIYATTMPTGLYETDDAHMNSFYFDEQERCVYLGFRDVSRVLKVAYPSGEVLRIYDGALTNDVRDTAKKLFCWQHSCRHSAGGYIYMFNNNTCHHGGLPTIALIADPKDQADTLNKIWEYTCAMEGDSTNRQYQFANGGNVIELADGSLFANMSHELYTRVFIAGRDKTLLWDAIPERWNAAQQKWLPVFQYRASIVPDAASMKRLICNEADK